MQVNDLLASMYGGAHGAKRGHAKLVESVGQLALEVSGRQGGRLTDGYKAEMMKGG